VGQPAPDFRLTLLDGSSLTLQDLRGQVVVVNFWASWCPPCKDEMPDLQESWEAYGDRGVSFVGVAYQDERPAVEAALAEFGTTYPVGMDAGDRVAGLYGITGIPETFIVDQQGRVSYVHVGPLTAEMLSVELDALLGSSGD
jgi:DsbE subfamily thiol:disulfide oxidoreductase